MTYDTINDAVTIAGGAEGALLANRYRVVRQLGQGGMGSVWLAEDTQLDNKLFAIKMLPSILVSNKRAYRQLKDEAIVAMKLVHPNIVTLRAFEENNGNPFLVMDYIDGETLDDYLAEKGKLSEDETVKLLKPIAAALDYAHNPGVVHRDVKPGNIMVRKDGVPFVMDFGIAREMQETLTRVTGKLSSGTLLYMSPEQLNGDAPKPAQDIYSFAAMTYECLKGEPPFVRGAIEDQIRNKQPEQLTANCGALSAGVLSGLAKRAEERPPSCAAVLACEAGRSGRVARAGGKGLDKALGVLALLAALAACGYYGWTKYDEIRQANKERIANLNAKKEACEAESEKSKRQAPVEAAKSIVKQPTVEEIDIIEIRVQAAKCENAMGRISSEDGFGAKKDALSDDLAAARTYDSSKRWSSAAVAYTNFVNDFKSLAQLNRDRNNAQDKRAEADAARQAASNAQAAEHASPRWNEAERLFKNAKEAWTDMKFADSAKKYGLAAVQFGLAKSEADKERERQEEERREHERKAAAERKRRENWPEEGREFVINRHSLFMKMKWCPKGSFTMGSPTSEDGRYDSEIQHPVTLTKGFWMGETEVTQGQWKQLMNGETILDLARKGLQDDEEYYLGGKRQKLRDFFSKTKYSDPQEICSDVSDNVPVYYVSWNEAVEFCRRLTQKECAEGRIPDGYEYRLPTEAEWEYACRAGETASLPNGKAIRILGANNAPALDDIAWYGGNSSVGFDGRGWDTTNWKGKQYDDKRRAAPRDVKGKRANDWGLYDMIGNVWEWCGDYFGGYPTGVVTDPYNTTYHVSRVFRGGGWTSDARYCRPAARSWNYPGLRNNGIGFRVALAPILSKEGGDVGAFAEVLAAERLAEQQHEEAQRKASDESARQLAEEKRLAEGRAAEQKRLAENRDAARLLVGKWEWSGTGNSCCNNVVMNFNLNDIIEFNADGSFVRRVRHVWTSSINNFNIPPTDTVSSGIWSIINGNELTMRVQHPTWNVAPNATPFADLGDQKWTIIWHDDGSMELKCHINENKNYSSGLITSSFFYDEKGRLNMVGKDSRGAISQSVIMPAQIYRRIAN